MNSTPIVLSDIAAIRLRGILSKGKYKAIRFAMSETEQGRLAPSMYLVDEVSEGDMLFDEGGISVLMDKETAEVLEGAEVDFVREGEDEHFVLTGGLTSGCGCGSDSTGGSCGCGCGGGAEVGEEDA
jgi:iron-sulfur cluster assembly protein